MPDNTEKASNRLFNVKNATLRNPILSAIIARVQSITDFPAPGRVTRLNRVLWVNGVELDVGVLRDIFSRS